MVRDQDLWCNTVGDVALTDALRLLHTTTPPSVIHAVAKLTTFYAYDKLTAWGYSNGVITIYIRPPLSLTSSFFPASPQSVVEVFLLPANTVCQHGNRSSSREKDVAGTAA